MAEWKLTDKTINVGSEWKPTGKTYEQLPNAPEKIFPTNEELHKANVKQLINPSNTNGIAKKPSLSDVLNKGYAINANNKLLRGESLTPLEQDAFKKSISGGFGEPVMKISPDLMANNNPGFIKLRDSAFQIQKKKDSGKQISEDENNILETFSIWRDYQKKSTQNLSTLTSDPNKNAQNINTLFGTMLYNDTAYNGETVNVGGNEIKTSNKLLLSAEKSKNRADLYINTGLSQFASGVNTTIDVISGKKPEDIAAQPNDKYSIASSLLKDYYNKNGDKFNSVVQDTVTNMASNAIPMLIGIASGGAGLPVAISQAIGVSSFGVSVFGNSYKEAASLGVTEQSKLLTYAFADTALECGLQYAIGGIPGMGGALSGKLIERLSQNASNVILKAAIKGIGNGLGETIEEGMQSLFSPILKKYILDANVETVFDNPKDAFSQAAYDGFIGFLTSVLMGGFGNVSEAVSEQQIQSLGNNYNEIFKNNNVDIKSVAEYFKTTADKNGELIKSAEKVLNGDNSNITVGAMLNQAFKNSRDSMAFIYQKIGQTVKNQSGQLEALNSAYEKMTDNGLQFPEDIEQLHSNVKLAIENGINLSDETVGKFALGIQTYAPRALIMKELTNNVSDSNAINPEMQPNAQETDAQSQPETVPQQEMTTKPIEKSQSSFEEKSAKPISTVKGDIIGEVVTNNIGTKKLTANQRQIKSIGKAFGIEIDFADVVTPGGLHADGVFKDGKVIIDYNTKDPVRYVVKHELTHFTESNDNYGDFVKVSKNSKVYANWVKGYSFLDSELAELASNTKSVPKLSGYIREDIINHYANNGVELSPELAERELFAKFCGECFFTDTENQQKALDSLLKAAQTQEQRNSITQFFKDLIEWFKAKLGGDHNITLELVKLQNEWARMVKQSAELTVNEKTATESDGVKYSFAGEKAQTANIANLDAAKRRIESGEDPETVRRKTGWFKGYDGKWRFEIGDIDSFLIENPNLERHTDDGEVYFTGKLSDILDHKKLFEAYPELKNINVVIQETNLGIEGSFQPSSNYITLSIEQFKKHTKEYNDYLNGNRKSEIDRIEQTQEYKEYNKLYDEYSEMNPVEWLELELAARKKFYSSELGKKYHALKWGKNGFNGNKFEFGWDKGAKSVLLHELQHAVQNVEGFASGASTSNENYDRVSGEIEARDVSTRMDYTDEQRKNTRPDIDRTDVVLAESENNTDQFSIPSDTDSEYLELAKDPEKNKARLQEMVDEVAEKSGYTVKAYHGTPNEFTVFDKNKIGSNTDDGIYGKGFYFSTFKAQSEQYSKKVMSLYLNIKNPFVINEYNSIQKMADYLNVYEGNLKYNPSMKTIMPVYSKADQFASHILDLGHDGIIADYGTSDEIVVFDPNQIKSADPVTYDDNGNVIPLSERFNEKNEDIRYSIPENQTEIQNKFDSGEITADEYKEATQENWESAVKKYGAFQPEAETPTPKSVDGEKSVTRVVNNILNHTELTAEQFNALEVETLMNEMSHEVFGDINAVKKAEEAYKKGIAVEKWDKARTSAKYISKDDIAVGVLLLKKTIEDKNTVRFMELASELSEVATRAGQLVQAYSLISKMNGIGKLMTLQKMVDKMNTELDKKFKGKFAPIKIDETLAGQIAKSKMGEDITSIVEDVKQDIANQVPVTFLDKWNAWRYMAMLTNPKTHIRNLVGNAIFTPFVRTKDIISASLEQFIPEDQRTKSIIIKKEYLEFAEKDKTSDTVKSAFDNGGKYNDATDIQQMRKIFKTAALEWVRETNSNLLEAEDLFFKNRHYVHALAGFLQARNADLNNVDSELLDKARNYAINEAMKATFNDANALSSWLNAAARQGIAADVFMGGLLPFKKTPINIVRRGVEYSPIGLLTTLTKGVYDLKSGKINTSEFIDGLGAGISGTVPALVGMLFASLGWVTGSFGDDKEEKFKILNGEQEYSLQILGNSYTVDWAAPACIPFFIGIEVMNSQKEKFTFANVVDSSAASLDPIINLSCLSGIQNTLNSVRYEENNQVLFAIGNSILSSYAGQAFPSAFGALARTMDDTRRTTYVDKNSQVPEILQRVVQTAQGKIPFLENKKAAMIDNWGRKTSNGTVTERVLENFVSPGYYSKVEYDKVNKELARLSKETGSEVLPPRSQHYIRFDNKRIDFTADEYEKFATERGTKSFEIVEEIINNKLYSKMSDSQKADAIKEAYVYAYEYAKSQVSDFEMKSMFKRISTFSKSKIANYFIAKAKV